MEQLQEEEVLELRKKISESCVRTGIHLVLTLNEFRNPRQLYCNGVRKTVSQWQWILAHGEYDTNKFYVETACDVEHCIEHQRLRSGEMKMEDWTEAYVQGK